MTPTAIAPPFDLEGWRHRYGYQWPDMPGGSGPWRAAPDGQTLVRELPETRNELKADSRWPAFFPSSMCLVTASDGGTDVLEKVVGASIVNRFPYVVALSFCREQLSDRHHARRRFTDLIEKSGNVAIQFLPQGASLDRAMSAITSTTDAETASRIRRGGSPTTLRCSMSRIWCTKPAWPVPTVMPMVMRSTTRRGPMSAAIVCTSSRLRPSSSGKTLRPAPARFTGAACRCGVRSSRFSESRLSGGRWTF
jgi:hypothetical protein